MVSWSHGDRARRTNAAGRQPLRRACRRLSRQNGLPTILVEQNVSAAMRVADRVMILNNGAAVFDGTPDEVRTTNVWHYF